MTVQDAIDRAEGRRTFLADALREARSEGYAEGHADGKREATGRSDRYWDLTAFFFILGIVIGALVAWGLG